MMPSLPAALAPDWRSLLELLDTYPWQQIPCRTSSDPGRWTSDELPEREAAAAECATCPAIDQCAAYKARNPKEFGTYGGQP